MLEMQLHLYSPCKRLIDLLVCTSLGSEDATEFVKATFLFLQCIMVGHLQDDGSLPDRTGNEACTFMMDAWIDTS